MASAKGDIVVGRHMAWSCKAERNRAPVCVSSSHPASPTADVRTLPTRAFASIRQTTGYSGGMAPMVSL
eukprot:589061-Alexandrium_andersonii.AAC.1